MPNESLNIRQIAKRAKVDESTLRNYRTKYDLPFFEVATGAKKGQIHSYPELVPVVQQIKELGKTHSQEEIEANISEALQPIRIRIRNEDQAGLAKIDQEALLNGLASIMRDELHEHDKLTIQQTAQVLVKDLVGELMHEQREHTSEIIKQMGNAQAKVLELSSKLAQAQTEANLLPDLTAQTEEAQKRAETAAKELETYKQKCERLEKEGKAKSLDLSIQNERIDKLEAQSREKDQKIESLSSQLQAISAELEETRAQLQEAKRPWWKSKK